jgi:hypothetical protein
VNALDTNMLVYAHRRDSPWHARALEAVSTLAEGRARWALPWPCVHEFFAIVTHPRIYSPPTSVPAALAQIEAWLESPSIELIAEDVGYWPALRQVLQASRVEGPRVHDAPIATSAVSAISQLVIRCLDLDELPGLCPDGSPQSTTHERCG